MKAVMFMSTPALEILLQAPFSRAGDGPIRVIY